MPSIKQEIAKGVFWIAVARYSGIFISLGITAILARNVSPAAFGTMAVATVITAFLDIFIDMGFGTAIVQFKDLTKRQINSIFMVGTGIGIILALGMYFASTLIADYYNDTTLVTVCRCLCIPILFGALNIVPNGLMMKAKRFKTVAIRTLSFQILCGTVAVIGALHGWGIYALIVTPVISSIGVFTVNFINYPQRLTLDIDFSAIRRVWSYSSFQFLFNFVNYFSRNLDKLIIGRYFSMAQLGYYDKSYRLMQLPLQNITFVISPVLHPILSSLQDDKKQLGEKNRKLVRTLSYISFPLGILLYFSADNIIDIIFGPDWKPSIPVFQILALSLPLQIILSTSGSLYQAAGKTNHMFYVGLSCTLTTVAGFLIAAHCFHTLAAMAWAWDITLMINFITCYTVMNRITFRTSLRRFALDFIPQIINTVVATVVAYYLISLIDISNSLLALIYKTIAVALPTLIMAIILHQYNALQLLKSALSRLHCGR